MNARDFLLQIGVVEAVLAIGGGALQRIHFGAGADREIGCQQRRNGGRGRIVTVRVKEKKVEHGGSKSDK